MFSLSTNEVDIANSQQQQKSFMLKTGTTNHKNKLSTRCRKTCLCIWWDRRWMLEKVSEKSSSHTSAKKITVVYVFSLVTWNPRSDSPSSALQKKHVNADNVYSSWIKQING